VLDFSKSTNQGFVQAKDNISLSADLSGCLVTLLVVLSSVCHKFDVFHFKGCSTHDYMLDELPLRYFPVFTSLFRSNVLQRFRHCLLVRARQGFVESDTESSDNELGSANLDAGNVILVERCSLDLEELVVVAIVNNLRCHIAVG